MLLLGIRLHQVSLNIGVTPSNAWPFTIIDRRRSIESSLFDTLIVESTNRIETLPLRCNIQKSRVVSKLLSSSVLIRALLLELCRRELVVLDSHHVWLGFRLSVLCLLHDLRLNCVLQVALEVLLLSLLHRCHLIE